MKRDNTSADNRETDESLENSLLDITHYNLNDQNNHKKMSPAEKVANLIHNLAKINEEKLALSLAYFNLS